MSEYVFFVASSPLIFVSLSLSLVYTTACRQHLRHTLIFVNPTLCIPLCVQDARSNGNLVAHIKVGPNYNKLKEGISHTYGARFPTECYTRGCHRITRLLA